MARRLAELSKLVPLQALNPEPWFPMLRPGVREQSSTHLGYQTDVRKMFYFPGVAKHLDAWWMKRCVGRWLDSLSDATTQDAILDAHFGYPEGVGSYLAARERGMRTFITIRGLEVDLFHHPKIGPQLIEALNQADGVIAVSHSLRQAALAAGAAPKHIEVIPNGVDIAQYSPGNRAMAREELGIASDVKLLVSVGTLKQVKGHDVLLDAVARLPVQSCVRLVCIGSRSDSPWVKSLEQKADRLGIRDQIQFIGAREPAEVVTWLRASNLFTLASRREGCCNAVLEALACGVPVAVTTAGDNAWFVKPGINGELAPPDDAAALSEAIQAALETSYCTDEIVQSVKATTWERTAASVAAFFTGATLPLSDQLPELAHKC